MAEPVSRCVPSREPVAPDPAADLEIAALEMMKVIAWADRMAVEKGRESEAAREDQRAWNQYAARLRLDLARLIGEKAG